MKKRIGFIMIFCTCIIGAALSGANQPVRAASSAYIVNERFEDVLAGDGAEIGEECMWRPYGGASAEYTSEQKNSGDYGATICFPEEDAGFCLDIERSLFSAGLNYRFTFYACSPGGKRFTFKLIQERDGTVVAKADITAETWKKYTFVVGRNFQTEFDWDTSYDGDYQLIFCPDDTEDAPVLFLDDITVTGVTYKTLMRYDFENVEEGQRVGVNTNYDCWEYNQNADEKYAKYTADAAYNSNFGVEVSNTSGSVQTIQFYFGPSVMPDISKTYKVTFKARRASGNRTWRFNSVDTNNYIAKPICEINSDQWTDFSLLMGPESSESDLDFIYPADHSGNMVLQFTITSGTSKIHIDDFFLQEEIIQVPEVSLNAKDLVYAPTDAKVGVRLVKGNTVKASIAVTNTTAELYNFILIAARYGIIDNQLLDVRTVQCESTPGAGEEIFDCNMLLPSNEDLDNQKIKIMLITNFANAEPLARARTFPTKDIKLVTIYEAGLNYISGGKYLGKFYVEPMHQLGFPYEFYPW